MYKKYIVRLTDEERTICEATVKNEKGKSEKLRRAVILLKGGHGRSWGWNDEKISEAEWAVAFGLRENVRREFVLDELRGRLGAQETDDASHDSQIAGRSSRGETDRPAVGVKIHQPAMVIGRYDCSPTNWWNWRSSESISPETVRQTLKNGITKRKIEYRVIPPNANGEFAAYMEEVLGPYERAHDPDCPVVCIDEQPVQLIGETRVPIPAIKEHPERVGYEYERKETASIFMFAEPLSGFRQTPPRLHRTKDDWAHEVAQLLDTRYWG